MLLNRQRIVIVLNSVCAGMGLIKQLLIVIVAFKCLVSFHYMYFSHVGVNKSCEFQYKFAGTASTNTVADDVVMRCSRCFCSIPSF